MKKVLVIAPYPYLPFFSGGQKLVAQFLEYLGKETDLTVISTVANDFSQAKSYKGLPWLKKSFLRYIDISLVGKIISLVKNEKFDTIIWEHPYYAWLTRIIKERTGVKTIIHTHNIEYQRFRSIGRWWWPVLKAYEKWCFRFADHLFFITEEEKDFAITKWGIEASRCHEVPFGITTKQYPADRAACRTGIAATHGISENETIVLFNGLLDYKPNLDALLAIVNQINPYLLGQGNFRYKIIICGKGLPESFNELKEYADKNIIYAGFVNDIATYFKGADLFLNPVQSGGGIKTKMVEAIGFGTTVIATETGATGINKAVCNNKLVLVPDNDWKRFAEAIVENKGTNTVTPELYYEYYCWDNIIKRVKNI